MTTQTTTRRIRLTTFDLLHLGAIVIAIVATVSSFALAF